MHKAKLSPRNLCEPEAQNHVSTTKRASSFRLKAASTQVENNTMQFLVSLTELRSSFLRTPWVLPTLIWNSAAGRKDKICLVTWDEGFSEHAFNRTLFSTFAMWQLLLHRKVPEATAMPGYTVCEEGGFSSSRRLASLKCSLG